MFREQSFWGHNGLDHKSGYVVADEYSVGFSARKIRQQRSRKIITGQKSVLAGVVVVMEIFTADNLLNKGCRVFFCSFAVLLSTINSFWAQWRDVNNAGIWNELQILLPFWPDHKFKLLCESEEIWKCLCLKATKS